MSEDIHILYLDGSLYIWFICIDTVQKCWYITMQFPRHIEVLSIHSEAVFKWGITKLLYSLLWKFYLCVLRLDICFKMIYKYFNKQFWNTSRLKPQDWIVRWWPVLKFQRHRRSARVQQGTTVSDAGPKTTFQMFRCKLVSDVGVEQAFRYFDFDFCLFQSCDCPLPGWLHTNPR